MNLFHTILHSDPFTLTAWLGLAGCLVVVGASIISQIRFRARLKEYSMALAESFLGASTPRLPGPLSDCLRQLQTNAPADDRLLELRLLLKSRINRFFTTIRHIAPALGIAGTMSGAAVFLGEFGEHRLGGGRPDMQGLVEATATTWVGLAILILSVLVANNAQALGDSLAREAAEHLEVLKRTRTFAERDLPAGSSSSAGPLPTIDCPEI